MKKDSASIFERRSADSPGISLYVQDNERNNQQLQFSAFIPQTRRREELGDRRRGTFPKELPRTEPKTPLSASSCCQLMVHPCRCYLGIWPALPGAGLDRFPPPSVSLTTRYPRSVFASQDLCQISSPGHFELPSVYLSPDPNTVQWKIAGLD
jgi:hypothetical protein